MTDDEFQSLLHAVAALTVKQAADRIVLEALAATHRARPEFEQDLRRRVESKIATSLALPLHEKIRDDLEGELARLLDALFPR